MSPTHTANPWKNRDGAMATTAEQLSSSYVNAVSGTGSFQVDSDSLSNVSMTFSWEPEPEPPKVTAMNVLLLIQRTPGIRISEVAESMGLSLSETYELVESLRASGLIGPHAD